MSTMTSVKDIRIPKVKDSDIISKFLQVSEKGPLKLGLTSINFSFREPGANYPSPKQLTEDAELKVILDQGQNFIKNATFHFDQNTAVSITRMPDEIADRININPGTITDVGTYFGFVGTVKRELGEIELNKVIPELIAADARKNFDARDLALRRLEEMSDGFFKKIQDLTTKQMEELDVQRRKLDSEYQTKRGEVEAQDKARTTEHKATVKEFEDRVKQYDDRDSRHVRRDIHTKLLAKFHQRAIQFELTKQTQALRRPIALLYGLLMLVFLAGAVYFAVTPPHEGVSTTVNIVRSGVFLTLFSVTVGFFIKWNNQWFRDHANEEFKLKRMELDVDRAGWIVEMAMEWKGDKGTEIPDFLVDRLSRSIFEHDQKEVGSATAADALASAILGSASSVKVKSGDHELELDRKGLDKLKKGK